MTSFKKNGQAYYFIENTNAGQKWQCFYENGESTLAMIYKSKPTKRDIISAIDEINSRKEICHNE